MERKTFIFENAEDMFLQITDSPSKDRIIGIVVDGGYVIYADKNETTEEFDIKIGNLSFKSCMNKYTHKKSEFAAMKFEVDNIMERHGAPLFFYYDRYFEDNIVFGLNAIRYGKINTEIIYYAEHRDDLAECFKNTDYGASFGVSENYMRESGGYPAFKLGFYYDTTENNRYLFTFVAETLLIRDMLRKNRLYGMSKNKYTEIRVNMLKAMEKTLKQKTGIISLIQDCITGFGFSDDEKLLKEIDDAY